MRDFLEFLAKVGGASVPILALLAFMFREKWRQVLQRSVGEDLERLKAQLQKEHDDHLAELAPQMEQVKHDFQQKLEAYKITLIAEAEAARSKAELRKSVALRFVELEFERLIRLEDLLSEVSMKVIPVSRSDLGEARENNCKEATEHIAELSGAFLKARIFLPHDSAVSLAGYFVSLSRFIVSFAAGREAVPIDDPQAQALTYAGERLLQPLQDRIRALGSVDASPTSPTPDTGTSEPA